MSFITPHQQLYYAWCLTHKKSIEDDSKFAGVLSEAKVDMNPHQVEAALFAFNSPLSKGAILADEVGLGKTIEAGIILSQVWAEGKRRIIIVVPASLRNQWSVELYEKFHLPSIILERNSYDLLCNTKREIKDINDKIVICSYNFSQRYANKISEADWDLVVIDEAHKLRNVYKRENIMAKAIKKLFLPYKKLLLTATPLQNNLKELYGLISIIDDSYFSSIEAFEERYTKVSTRDSAIFSDLKTRIGGVVHRTLRRDVQEYVNYTKRSSMIQHFEPTSVELELYNDIDLYLSNPSYGIPEKCRHLIALVIRKIMASSAYALSFTLDKIIERLETRGLNQVKSYNSIDNMFLDYEVATSDDDELINNFIEDTSCSIMHSIEEEISNLKYYKQRALDIKIETKSAALLEALKTGFSKISVIGASKKALIFTESKRTQEYLLRILESSGYNGRVAIFNGQNTSTQSSAIYNNWLKENKFSDKISASATINKKQAIIDFFKSEAEILIATEACAEGVNLQFCSLVINYDMPWNPQRIEQRIGRCHRYGQKHDVVVINFLNQQNRADQRVYELLSEKFNLFDGVFGCSDEVLGALESGVDFEKRLAHIYQTCRTAQEIDDAFNDLQNELEETIHLRIQQTQRSLIENFDEDVVTKLRVRGEKESSNISIYRRHLWKLAKSTLRNFIDDIDEESHSFTLAGHPLKEVVAGRYTLRNNCDSATQLRIGDVLGQYILKEANAQTACNSFLSFDLSNYPYKSALLSRYKGESGYVAVHRVSVSNRYDNHEELVFCAITKSGEILPEEFGQRLMEVDAFEREAVCTDGRSSLVDSVLQARLDECKSRIEQRAAGHITREIFKFESWEDDQVAPLQNEVVALRKESEGIKRTLRKENNPLSKLQMLEDKKNIDRKLHKKESQFYQLKKECSDRVDEMTDRLKASLENRIDTTLLFEFGWQID